MRKLTIVVHSSVDDSTTELFSDYLPQVYINEIIDKVDSYIEEMKNTDE